MEEIWKDVKDYEGCYQISNYGRVKSIERVDFVNNRWGTITQRLIKGRVLKPILNQDGYFIYSLHKDGKSKNVFAHRLVAEAFIPNTNNYPVINHKSEIKTENFVENLEWCTRQYNTNYGTARMRQVDKIKRNIIGFDGIHKLGVYFQSSADAERFFVGKRTSNINAVLRGKGKTAYGYRWEYV